MGIEVGGGLDELGTTSTATVTVHCGKNHMTEGYGCSCCKLSSSIKVLAAYGLWQPWFELLDDVGVGILVWRLRQ